MENRTERTASIVLLSTSLNSSSRSRSLVGCARETLESDEGIGLVNLDLRDFDLPFCNGSNTADASLLGELINPIREADVVLLGVPVYNYAASAAAKNLVELTGNAWNEKIVGFLLAAGGRSSYMAPMGLATSLMLDFRCLIIPKFVYAARGDFDASGPNESIRSRVRELAESSVRLAGAWPVTAG